MTQAYNSTVMLIFAGPGKIIGANTSNDIRVLKM